MAHRIRFLGLRGRGLVGVSVTVPATIQQRIDDALQSVRHHADHILTFGHRSFIYQAIETQDALDPVRARGWLGIMTAGRVLPLWEQDPTWQHTRGFVDPEDAEDFQHLPLRLLELAEEVLRGADDEI